MSINNNYVSNDYLKEIRDLRTKIADGDAVWSDALALRARYNMQEVSVDTIRKGAFLYDEFDKNGWIKEPNDEKGSNDATGYSKSVEIKNNGATTSELVVDLKEEALTDAVALLKAHGFDPLKFDLVSAKNTRWNSNNGKNLYSSKIVVQPVKNKLDYEDIASHFENFKSPHTPVTVNKTNDKGGKMVVFGHFDVHFGRVASGYETGEDYNMDIAANNMRKTTSELINSINKEDVDRIVYVIGQDFFNSSFTGYTTSQSHMQDNETTFNTIFKRGGEIIIECIDMLAQVAPVTVILSVGNHARFEENALAQLIAAYYRNDENVIVNSNPFPRKYVEYGVNCIGLTHGSDEKERIYTLMQSEVPEIWGRTKTRVWLTGHIHHRTVLTKEDSNVIVFSMSAMAKPDNWTVKSGYTMAMNGCSAYIFDFNKGLSGIEFFYV